MPSKRAPVQHISCTETVNRMIWDSNMSWKSQTQTEKKHLISFAEQTETNFLKFCSHPWENNNSKVLFGARGVGYDQQTTFQYFCATFWAAKNLETAF